MNFTVNESEWTALLFSPWLSLPEFQDPGVNADEIEKWLIGCLYYDDNGGLAK
jgi:hypothetical protein